MNIQSLLMKSFFALFLFVQTSNASDLEGCNQNAFQFKNFVKFSQIAQIVQKCKISTIEQFLAILPDEIRKRYTLVYETHALGVASLEKPRIILSGHKNYLTMSVGTTEDHPSYLKLEVMEYADSESQGPGVKPHFNFQFIDFNQDGHSAPKFSVKNPQICLACHQDPSLKVATPIWGIYPMWPGVYGSIHDVHTFATPKPDSPVNYQLGEKTAYETLIKPKIGTTDRFQFLRPIYDQVEEHRFRTGFAIDGNFNDLMSIVKFQKMSDIFKDRKIESQRFKYLLQYISSCVSKGVFTPKLEPKDLASMIETLVKPEELQKIVKYLGSVYGANTLVELIEKMKAKKLSERKQFQSVTFDRVCTGFKALERRFNPGHELTCQDVENVMDHVGISEFDIAQMQWIDATLVSFVFESLGINFDGWMYNHQLGSYFPNNLNSIYNFQDVAHTFFDTKQTDPALYEFFESRRSVYWPMISDLGVVVIKKKDREALSNFCKDLKAKSYDFTSLL